MNKTDEILDRLKDWQPVIDNPDELTESIMAKLPEKERQGQQWKPIAGHSLQYVSTIAAAVLVAVVTLFTWKSFTPENQPQLAEKTEEIAPQEDTPNVVEKDNVVKTPTKHVKIANVTREVGQLNTRCLESSQPTIADEAKSSTETPVLANAADSLYYYLTQLENQMGDCRDSTCFAELGNLIQADERIKGLVNKIIHKQVETAYKEEYLVDTTTHYVPL